MASSILDRIAEIMEVPKDDPEEVVSEIQALLDCLDDLNLAKQSLARSRDAAIKQRDTLREGICRVIDTDWGEYVGYTDWDQHLVGHLEMAFDHEKKEIAEVQHSANTFYSGLVDALGLPPTVYTEEQIIHAVRDTIENDNLERDINALYEKNFTAAGIPLGTDLSVHIAAIKQRAEVKGFMDATSAAKPLHDEIAALKAVIFAQETREIMLRADLKRANDALAAADL
jgi:hypothetical protein